MMSLKSLQNALTLLNHFNSENSVWGVRDLARVSGMHPAVVQRMLVTFAAEGFLVQDPDSKKYLLGLRFFELGQLTKQRLKLSDFILPIMNRLAQEENETVFLTILDRDRGICAEIAESPNPIKFSMNVGTGFPLSAGAHARVILAWLSSEKQKEILEAPQSPFRGKSTAIFKDLLDVREKGWCVSLGEYDSETFGIAIPLFSSSRNVLGSLGIAGPLSRFEPDKVQQQAEMMLREQRAVERALQVFQSVQKTT